LQHEILVTKNLVEAGKYFKILLKHGNLVARINWTHCLEKGEGIIQILKGSKYL
jgi:hypothetical protein